MYMEIDPITGRMTPKVNPAKEISKALIPINGQIPNWIGMRTVREGVKICYNRDYYLAMCFNGKWRLLGIIKNMPAIEKHLRGPLVNFHDAWLRGTPIDEPKLN